MGGHAVEHRQEGDKVAARVAARVVLRVRERRRTFRAEARHQCHDICPGRNVAAAELLNISVCEALCTHTDYKHACTEQFSAKLVYIPRACKFY